MAFSICSPAMGVLFFPSLCGEVRAEDAGTKLTSSNRRKNTQKSRARQGTGRGRYGWVAHEGASPLFLRSLSDTGFDFDVWVWRSMDGPRHGYGGISCLSQGKYTDVTVRKNTVAPAKKISARNIAKVEIA